MTVADGPGRAYERSVAVDRRRRDGIHYTPPGLAAEIAAAAFSLTPSLPQRVLDPTCGAGAVLLAALDALVEGGLTPAEAIGRVHGIDSDADAIAVARHVLTDWSTSHGLSSSSLPDDALLVGDALDGTWPRGVDMVLGNPPFGGQLRGSTVRRGGASESARRLLGRAGGYVDTAGLFLVRAVESVVDGGVVALVQPMSFLAGRDAGLVRSDIGSRARLSTLLLPDDAGFDASVQVCVPVLEVGPGRSTAPSEWSARAAAVLGLDEVELGSGATLGAIADVTAGFREEFYAVARFVAEGEADDPRPRLVTSGAIEPGCTTWGARPSTVLRRRFLHPVVDVEALGMWANGADGCRRLVTIMGRRREPKVLVATQTRRLEAVCDPDGSLWPSVPVVSVLPKDADPWPAYAVLVSTEATSWLARRSVGTGLSRGAVRVSASVLSTLPLPGHDPASWSDATRRLRAGASVDDAEVLAAMSRAYGTTPATR